MRTVTRTAAVLLVAAASAAAVAGDRPDQAAGLRYKIDGDRAHLVAESPDGAWLALAGSGKTQLFPRAGGKPVTIVTKDTRTISFTSDSKWVVVTSAVTGRAPDEGRDEHARAWLVSDAARSQELALAVDPRTRQPRIVRGIVPLGGARVAVVQRGLSRTWDLATGKQDGTLAMKEDEDAYARSPDGAFSAVVSFPDVEVRDRAGKPLWRTQMKGADCVEFYARLAFSRDGSVLAIRVRDVNDELRVEGRSSSDGKTLWQLPVPPRSDYPHATKDGFALLRDGKVAFLAKDGKEQAYVGLPDGRGIFDIFPTADGAGVWAIDEKTGTVERVAPPPVTPK